MSYVIIESEAVALASKAFEFVKSRARRGAKPLSPYRIVSSASKTTLRKRFNSFIRSKIKKRARSILEKKLNEEEKKAREAELAQSRKPALPNFEQLPLNLGI
jgi:hypothetical protein